MPQPRCQPRPPPGLLMERGLSPARQRWLQPPRHRLSENHGMGQPLPGTGVPCGTLPGVCGEEVGSRALPGCAHATAWPCGHRALG